MNDCPRQNPAYRPTPSYYLFGRNQRLISGVFAQKITIFGKPSVKASSGLLR